MSRVIGQIDETSGKDRYQHGLTRSYLLGLFPFSPPLSLPTLSILGEAHDIAFSASHTSILLGYVERRYARGPELAGEPL